MTERKREKFKYDRVMEEAAVRKAHARLLGFDDTYSLPTRVVVLVVQRLLIRFYFGGKESQISSFPSSFSTVF